ncbi:PKD domain-containing protein [Teichococcus vastitatis]|uniref:Uncharacterized protein n=1 Tax=Teichococcus vastitatis TaxID=2307076 RepID=A0ABS9W6L6_9PROT|nr:hypothetical protein [Pseudoroseomonas vastitatis]MCI0754877.1 hypothetical protein [Pseudoroseomonas vastitatis]
MAIHNGERLSAAGPINPDHGFPMWFEDGEGTRLDLALRPDPLTPAVGELPSPGAPLQFPDNFPDEAFYFAAEAELPIGGTDAVGRARVIMALEAAFGGAGSPSPGANVVFARLRVRIDDAVPGAAYVVKHPYGETDPLEADDRGRVAYTEDLGVAEGNPTAVLGSGRIAPFLKWAAGAPDGYLGDGATEREIVGSPFGYNAVRISGPRIAEGGGLPDPEAPGDPDRIWTNLFTVQGRLATRFGAAVAKASYAVKGGQVHLRVQATSVPDQSLELVAPGVRIELRGEGANYAGIAAPPGAGEAELVNVTDQPPSRWPVVFTDEVVVQSALHNLDDATLTVSAGSSDPAAALTIPALGLSVTEVPQIFAGVAAAPAVLEVKSDKGGVGSQRVELAGTPASNLGVVALAVLTSGAVVGEEVVLDGSGSRAATAFAWAQTAGQGVALTAADAATARFTPQLPGEYAFRLTVQGEGGPDIAELAVTVAPEPGPDTLQLTRAEFRTGRRQFRVEGTVTPIPNQVTILFGGAELGSAQADADGAWSVRRVMSDAEMGPAPGDEVEIRSRRAARNQQVLIRN